MDSIDYSAKGIVFDIQRYSIHDGPGIRTIVFLKGCPLSCLWCCNPESQRLKPSIMFSKKECIRCGKCISACKYYALDTKNENIVNHSKCVGCGECVNVCPTSALVLKGKSMTVEQLVKELKKDAITFRRSGGGITISGGEPLVQARFVTELLKACKSQGWHTAMETTGYGNKEDIEKAFAYLDLALLDIKAMDREVHKQYTGIYNDLIIKNAVTISQITKTVIRVPTIVGVNASEESYKSICKFIKTLHNVEAIHLLPYHSYGENKYDLMGTEYKMKDEKTLTKEEIESLKEIVEDNGLKCFIGG